MRPGNLGERSARAMGESENFNVQNGAAHTGRALQEARQERGLTHEDVERDTKIRVRYLEAMEREDYAALPGTVYAQGFLRTYANYLDLDGEKLAKELKDRQSASSAMHGPNTRPSRAERRSNRPGAVRFRKRRNRLSPVTIVGAVLALILLIVVVGGLYFVGLQASRAPGGIEDNPQQAGENTPSPEQGDAPQGSGNGASGEQSGEGDGGSGGAEQQPSQETGEPGSNEAGEGADTPTAPPPEPAPAEPPPPEGLTMEVRIEGNISWLNVEIDGNTVFEQVAEPGFSRTFEANESIILWSGNAGAVLVSVNGQDYGQLGESGQTVIQEFNLKTAEN